MENNNKELDYSRIKSLMNKVNEFVDTLPEELNKENGFSLLVIANDKMNKEDYQKLNSYLNESIR